MPNSAAMGVMTAIGEHSMMRRRAMASRSPAGSQRNMASAAMGVGLCTRRPSWNTNGFLY
jgi:hypothetical protein